MPKLRALSVALLAMTAPALAHHGWSWTEDGFFQLEGRIASIDLGNPHDMLDVEVDGEVWRVELAPPAATARSGFTEASAKVGDEVTAIGNRSQDPNERRMKAVRITVNGQTFDVYPSRVPTN
ncbi:MAG TPA: DUF6152 family protein [Mesorhizobium sp.]|jgi:membrane protein implicated in regulation of membrane protease activity|nr:DUF6152 family protein [Mesorhizobium sp.]